METKSKLSTKILSLFLSVLMALSCFSIALPGLAPEADAATAAQWTALRNAFADAKNNGYLATGNATVSTSGNNVTINDTSARGYLYNIAVLVAQIAKADNGSYDHNYKMRSYIKSNVGGLNSYQQAFVDSLLPVIGNYAYYSGATLTRTSAKQTSNTGAYPSNTLSNMTLTTKVTRTVKAAILNDCATAAAVPANINTSCTMTFNAAATSTTDYSATDWTTTHTEGSGTNKEDVTVSGTDWYFYRYCYYVNSSVGVGYGTSTAPNLSAITSYLNYVGGGSFKPGYTSYAADNTCIYNWDVATLSAVATNYNPYRTPLNNIEQEYLEKYIGQTNINNYDRYVNACTGAVEAAQYSKYVDWIMHGTPISGTINRDDYDPTVRVPENRVRMVALREQATSFLNTVNSVSSGTKTALINVYGYDVNAYAAYIEKLTDYIEVYDLTALYDETMFRIQNDETKYYGTDTSLWGVKNYESYPYTNAGTECPVDDTMLQQASSWFIAKYSAIMRFQQENIIKVFGDATASQVKAMRDNLSKEISYRKIEDNFLEDYYAYFESIRYTNYSKINNVTIENVIAAAEAKYSAMSSFMTTSTNTLGAAKAAQIFGSYKSDINAFIESLYDILYQRTYDQLYKMIDDALDFGTAPATDGRIADEITSANFSLVKRDIRDLDVDLYSWVIARPDSRLSAAQKNTLKTWYGYIPQYEAAVTAAIERAWSGWTKIQLDTPAGSGIYTTRYAREDDMVREPGADGQNDKYVVTETKINQVITKLDTFITSENFTKLLDVYDPSTGVYTLSDYIEQMLVDTLFNDKMVNTIVAMLFPMLSEMLVTTIKDLLKDGLGDLNTTPNDSYADGSINLEAIYKTLGSSIPGIVEGLDGNVDLYLDGKKNTKTLPQVFAELGLNLHPQYFANSLSSTANASKYSAFISALRAAGNDWNYFDRNGNNNGEVDEEDLAKYIWNVTDYNSFVTVIGDVFSSVLPILKVLFTNYTYRTINVENLIYAKVPNGKVGLPWYVGGDSDIRTDGYNVNTYITLTGIQGYNDIWAPIFEGLGVVNTTADYTSGYGVNNITTGTPLSTSFGTSGNSASAAQLANALFMPLMALVEQLANGPIEKLVSMLPNIAQYVSYNMITPLIDSLKTNVNIEAGVHLNDISGGLRVDIINWFRGTINDKLSNVVNTGVSLEIGSFIDLNEMLGFDLSDFNAIVEFILQKAVTVEEGVEEKQVSLPPINAGKLAGLGSLVQLYSIRSQNMSSSLGAKTRYYVKADKADVLYDLLSWVLQFIAIDGNLSGLMVRLGQKGFGDEMDAILGAIDAEDALAALVELFLPQDYAMDEYDWYQSNQAGSRYNLTSADFVYLKYANNWTQEKADYFYNNIDGVVNTIVNKIDPTMLAEYNGNINEYILAIVNKMFSNEGIMNVIKLVTGLGEALAGQDVIVNMVKDQLTTAGADAGVDLLAWYNTFGYLTYDYNDPDNIDPETGVLTALAPKKPGEAGYVNNFPALTVTVTDAVDEAGAPVVDADGNAVKEYKWSYNGTALEDGADNARNIFTDIFCELIRPFSPLLDLLFTGKDLGMFNNALVIGGYDCYQGAIIPVYEMLGIYDLKTQSEYEAYTQANGSQAGFNYLVDKLFDRATYLLSEDVMADGTVYGPIQKIIDLLPNLFYFLQSDGLSTVLKNLLHPLWVLIDTIRPVADADLDDFIHQFLCSYLGLVYDKTDPAYESSPIVDMIMNKVNADTPQPEYDATQAAKDKPLVDGIYELTLEDLSLETIYFVIETMFGFDLSPLSYAFEGMCTGYTKNGQQYGVTAYNSKTGKTAYKLDYYGPDTVTVTISVLLDLLRFEDGKNAKALDKMLGLIKDLGPETGTGGAAESSFTAQGLLEALLVVFEDRVDSVGEQPNWDYMLEGQPVEHPTTGETVMWEDNNYSLLQQYSDLSDYHSINNLKYYTDWTEDTAKATDEMLKNVLDYVVTLIDPTATSFESWINTLLQEKLFSGETLKTLAGLMGKLYDFIPSDIVGVVDSLLDINLTDWMQYVVLQDVTVDVTDDAGNKTGTTTEQHYVPREDIIWWADPTQADYVDTRDEFLAAVKQIILPSSKLFAFIFLSEDYRLFYTMDEGPGTPEYGDDAIVLDAAGAYAKGVIPILEAIGVDLTNYKPEKYSLGLDANGNAIYDGELFVSDLFEIVLNLVDEIIVDPVNWLINILPGVTYFVNANGISTSIKNIFGAVQDVIDAVNTVLDADQQIDLSTLVEGVDLTDISLGTVFGALDHYLGIHIRDDLEAYVESLYVGQIEYFQSANSNGAFRMTYSSVEERHDMITILLALVLEIITDSGVYQDADGNDVAYDNPAALDALISKNNPENAGMVNAIITALRNPEDIIYKDVNWNYFDETITLGTSGTITVPGYAFQYLNYTTDWTYDKASKTADGFENLLLGVLKMVDETKYGTAENLADVLADVIDLNNFYTGATLQKILDLVAPILYGENAVLNETLLNLVGYILGADLTSWNYEYAFEARDAAYTYVNDAETGLDYRTGTLTTQKEQLDADGNVVLDELGNPVMVDDKTYENVKFYAVDSRDEFIKGFTLLLKPAYRLLSWLLFGDSYEFFNGNTEATADDVLIEIQGANGYKEALALFLEALGCDGLGRDEKYAVRDAEGNATSVNMALFVSDFATSLCNRVDQIMADPATQIINLIPEILYFINAGGLQVSIGNLLAGPLNLLNKVTEITGNEALSLDGLVTDLLRKSLKNEEITFTLDGVNLQYIFTLAEQLTRLEITNVVGNALDKFYMGAINAYASASDKIAYKMSFSSEEDFADFITIVLSFIVDIALYEGNGAALETLLGLKPGLVDAILSFIRDGYTVEIQDIDWFYFDSTKSLYNEDGSKKEPAPLIDASSVITEPARTINYITYASDWTADTADYIFQNRDKIIAAVLNMTGAEDTDVGQMLKKSFNIETDLYTAATLNSILDAVKGITTGIDTALLDLLGIILDVDLSGYNTMAAFDAAEIDGSRTAFVNGLCRIVAPLYPILDWLLFGNNLQFFDKKIDRNDPSTGPDNIEILIDLPGSEGYAYGLVPLFEALGVTLPEIKEGDTTKDIFFVLVNNVLARVEGILNNPVDEVLALLPNILYFINANGLATSINNLLAGVVALLDKVNPALGEKAIDLETLLEGIFKGSNVTVDLTKLDLMAIATILEQATGIEITDVLTENKIENFYFGKMEYFTSANGKPAFRMSYSENEGGAEMLTILVNLVIEVLLYGENSKAIDILINGKDETTGEPKANTVQSIVDVLLNNREIEYIDLNWNYFDESVTLGEITVPSSAFVYLNYSNDWTYEKAAYLDTGLNSLVSEILKLTGSTAESAAELLQGAVNLDELLNADTLNKILDTIAPLLYGENAVLNESLLELVGLVLGADLTQWNNSYRFEAYDAANTAEGSENGLSYRTVDGVKTYAIANADNFADGLAIILKPAERLLGWLLLGDSYGFFVPNSTGNVDENGNRLDDELIRIAGAEGYDAGLVILLEALGCKNLKAADEYSGSAEMISTIIKSVVARVREILANPIDEALGLIPEILYFINAGGLNSVVNNLAGAVFNMLSQLEPLGVNVNVDELLTGVIKDALGDKAPADFSFSLADVNLQYVFNIVEMFTGLEIDKAIGYTLENFAIGEVVKYDSVSNYYAETYKMRFAETGDGTDAARDRADMITIVISLLLDVLMYKDDTADNAAAVEALVGTLKPGTIDAVINVIKGYSIDMMNIDWFYFDDTVDVTTVTEDTVLTMPERTINYLSYASDWTEETAQYLDDNLDAIISEVLALAGMEETDLAKVIAGYFKTEDLYTADNLNKIVAAVKGLTDQIGETLLNLVGVVLGADLSAYNDMTFAATEITDKATFVNGLVKVLTPIAPLLDWLLFGNDLAFFDEKDINGDGQVHDLIHIEGAEGYAYGLVPLLEALGVQLPAITADTKTEDILGEVIEALLARVEAILADPANEVLALLPNIFYFINANGLAASVHNLLGAAFGLLEQVNPLLEKLGSKPLDVNALINDMLKDTGATVDINKLDLLAVTELIEGVTGLEITDVITASKIDNFYLGQIEYLQSSNGKAAFKMAYTDEESRIDMLTVIVNLLVEVLVTEGNAEKLETLLGVENGAVQTIVTLLTDTTTEISYKQFNWNYFDSSVTLGDAITVPENRFIYLNYSNDWTYEKAAYFDTGLTTIVNQVLALVMDPPVTVEELVAQKVNLNELVFNAETLNKLLGTVSGLLYGESAVIGQHLGELAGLVLGADLTQWNANYSFEAYDSAKTYLTDSALGLRYTVADGKAVYAVETAEDFISGLCLILQPAEKLLGWLLMGEEYGFFVDNATGTQTLLKIKGANGYQKGLSLLLEALGVKGLKADYADTGAMLKAVLTAVVNRVEEILANPIDEVLALIPEIIYFINANGLGAVVNNLAAGVFHILDGVKTLGVDFDVNKFIEGVLQDALGDTTITFSLDTVNLQWIIELVEKLTGLDISTQIYSLEKFAIGEVYKYESVSGFNAYKMRFATTGNGTDKARDRADMITIVLSFAIDLLRNTNNQTVIEDMASLNAGTIAAVFDVISKYSIDIGCDTNWFYFDETVDVSTITADTDLTVFTPSINYLSYASDWSEPLADYLDDNLDGVIAAVLKLAGKEDTTVSQIVKGLFDVERDLYTAETLNSIAAAVKNLTAKLQDVILNVAGVLLEADLNAYNSMDFGTGAIGRDDFIDGLVEIVKPIYRVLDWLLFGEDLAFFDKLDTTDGSVENLITVNGYEGYAYGLVPLLEALGVKVPTIDYSADTYNTEGQLRGLIDAVLYRVEEILVDPVDNVLALIPNLLYFINANGLASSVNHLAGAGLALVEKVNPLLEKLGSEPIDINALINGIAALQEKGITIDIKNINLLTVFEIAEKFTGLSLVEFVTAAKIENFYLGQITHFVSANGQSAFKMVYSADAQKDRADLITVLVNYLIEAALYKNEATGANNTAALETLLGLEAGAIEKIVEVIIALGAEYEYTDINWDYCGVKDAETGVITVNPDKFSNYLTYVTDWTQSKADYLYDNLDEIVAAVLRMTGKEGAAATVEGLVSGLFNLNDDLYTAENLNKIVDLTKKLYELADEKLVNLAGLVLGADVSAWQGLTYTDAEIVNRETFTAGLIEIISPLYRLLDWLLFADDYEFFVKAADGSTTLLNIAGSKGYAMGLVPLFEALGVELPAIPADAKCENMFEAVINAVLDRAEAILADPVDEALRLIPNLLYFINAGGVSTAVTNLAGGILTALDMLNERGITDINLTELLGGLDITNITLTTLFSYLEGLDALKGLKLNAPFTGFYADGRFTQDMSGENLLEGFYIGKISMFASTNGYRAYKMSFADDDADRGDLLTMLLSIVLEVALYDDNAAALDTLFSLKAGTVDAVKALLGGVNFEMSDIDWVYFLDLDETERQAEIDAVLAAQVNNLPTPLPERTLNYLKYSNNWNEETADYLDANLVEIVDMIIALVSDSANLNEFINANLNIYSDEIANKLLGYIANLLKKVDAKLQETIGVVLDVDLVALTEPVTGVTDKASFVAALSDRLSNLGSVLDWLLFNQKMTFFTDLATGTQATITLNGSEGYKYGLAPILAALGIETVLPEVKADGTTITEQVLPDVLTLVCNRIDEILANPIDEVLALLPNLIYFINANGVSASALNLLAPVDQLVTEAGKAIGDESITFANLIHFDISNLDFEGICQLVKDKTGLDVWGAIGEYLAKFYFGKLDYYESHGGMGGFRMVYTDTEERHDMITILITLVLDVVSYSGNREALIDMLGGDQKAEGIYNTIMAFLTNGEVEVDMQQFSWLLTKYANTGIALSPITMGSIFNYIYGPLYTREMGEYITKFFPDFVDTMIVLLGIERPDGNTYKGLEDILNQLIGTSIYKTSLLETILETIQGLVAKLKNGIGEELFNHVATVLNNSLGVNLAHWDNYQINAITEGDKTAFVNELVRMLQPAYPLLEWLLTDKDIAFFNDQNGDDYVVIEGAEGYAYSIIPILEAFGCSGVLSIDEYKAAAAQNKDNVLLNVINPILGRVDEILADPLNEILDVLPAVIYFINSNGLDTAFKNALNAVFRVLETIEPLTGEIDLYEVLGFSLDINDINIEGLLNEALTSIEEKYGFKLSSDAFEAIKELTVGEVVTFDSKSGQTVYDGKQAYTMVYATGADKVDLATIILRLILKFVSIPENVTAIEAMLNGKLSDTGYQFLCSLLENFSQMAATADGMDKIMYTVYYIFYSANVAAHETENWLYDFNGNYSFLNQLFATSDLAFLRQLQSSLGSLLNKYTGDIIDDDEIVPNGFIKFFQQIKDFFQKIINFFKNLFS